MRRCFLKPSILLPRSLFDALVDQRTLRQPRETGGFLLGVRRGPHLEITHHTAQGWSDIATRSSFERRGAHHQRDAEAIWRRTVGEVGLIGDWHTHPVGSAEPSETDRRAWRQLLARQQLTGVGMILSPAEVRMFWLRRGLASVQVTEAPLQFDEDDDLVFTCP